MEAPRELASCLTEAQVHVQMVLEHDEDFLQSFTFREQRPRACIACRLHHTPPILLRVIADVGIITRKTYDEDALGVLERTQENCFISSQGNSFINMEIFNDWVKNTFVPELSDRRRK
jgi:hypothetical protein